MFLLCFMLFATTLLTECVSQDIDFTQPVSPADYQELIAQGFATNYFKTQTPTAFKYRTQNIKDIYDKGFRNVRLRCRPELYDDNYTTPEFRHDFLSNLTEVVDECIKQGVAPIISWEHHSAEAYATENDRKNYIEWWTIVAKTLNQTNYHLSFNLFTELGVDICRKNGGESACVGSLRRNKEKYHNWTSEVIHAIRESGGNNAERILILGSPEKDSTGLSYIDPDAEYMDDYMMVEWHEYAAGPSFASNRPRYWSGNGSVNQTRRLREGVERANNFTAATNIPTYFGAWMPRDNEFGGLDENEVVSFARFFVNLLRKENIPWSLNVIDNYYRTKKSEWRTDIQDLKGAQLNMSRVLDNILEVM